MTNESPINLGPFSRGEKVEIVVINDAVDIPIGRKSQILRDHAVAMGLPVINIETSEPTEAPKDLAHDLLTRVVNDWPQFDGPEPVNGGDAVEYLESLRAEARKLLGIPKPTPPVDQPPMAFIYYVVKPCFEDADGDIESFLDEAARDECAANRGEIIRTFWTVYGVYLDIDGGHLEMEIADCTLKADAMQIMNAILSPMAKARDELYDALQKARETPLFNDAVGILDRSLRSVADVLSDVIAQSSNGERL